MRRPSLRWLLLAILLGCAAYLSHQALARTRYPSRSEVSKILKGLDRQTPAQRQRAIGTLLERLLGTESISDDEVITFAFTQISATFREKLYIDILSAMDAAHIDGGFANDFCAAYSRMSDIPAFVEHYRTNSKPLVRCIGITFHDEDEIRRRLSGDTSTRARGPAN